MECVLYTFGFLDTRATKPRVPNLMIPEPSLVAAEVVREREGEAESEAKDRNAL